MTMRKLLATTALSIGLAMPVAAQTNDQTGQTQTQATQGQQQAQGMQIMVSSLIGRTIYMPGQMGGGQMGAGDEASATSGSGNEGNMTDGMSAQEQNEVAQGGLEGEAEELEQGAENVASDVGQAVENTAEDVAQAGQNAWDNLEREVSEVPEGWQQVGEIGDVVVTRQGEVRALLVDSGGFLGAGETERRIDIENVRFVADSDDQGEYYVVFAGDRQMFEEQGSYDQARAEEQGEMRATENEAFAQEVAAQGRGQRDAMEQVEWTGLTTEELLGTRVYGANDEWVGDLSELSLSENGEIEGVIIDVGGFLGIGEKPVMMSLDQVELRRESTGLGDGYRAYVNATEEELDAMEEWVDPDL
jgi:hypothetical protein